MNTRLAIKLLMYLLISKALIAIVLVYRDYFPPNFRSGFLLGRSSYFFGTYRWAFYLHIFSGPLTLVAGMLLVSNSFRMRFPHVHRRIGRAQVVCILFLMTPSGLWMARYASAPIAGAGFATLAVATAGCAAMGWRTAVARRFAQHRNWMLRCFALLCSAVVLRLIGGLSELMGVEWTYPYAAWASWLIPLGLLEWFRLRRSR